MKRLHLRHLARHDPVRVRVLEQPCRPLQRVGVDKRLEHARRKHLQQPLHQRLVARLALPGRRRLRVRRAAARVAGLKRRRRRDGARLARRQRRALLARQRAHQRNHGRRRLGPGPVVAPVHRVQRRVQEPRGGLDLEAAVQHGEHAAEGDELLRRCWAVLGGIRLCLLLLCLFVVFLLRLGGHLFHHFQHLENHLARVAQVRDPLQARLAAGHGNQHLDQVPANLARERHVIQYISQRREHRWRERHFDYGEVRGRVRRRRLALPQALDDIFSRRHAVFSRTDVACFLCGFCSDLQSSWMKNIDREE